MLLHAPQYLHHLHCFHCLLNIYMVSWSFKFWMLFLVGIHFVRWISGHCLCHVYVLRVLKFWMFFSLVSITSTWCMCLSSFGYFSLWYPFCDKHHPPLGVRVCQCKVCCWVGRCVRARSPQGDTKGNIWAQNQHFAIGTVSPNGKTPILLFGLWKEFWGEIFDDVKDLFPVKRKHGPCFGPYILPAKLFAINISFWRNTNFSVLSTTKTSFLTLNSNLWRSLDFLEEAFQISKSNFAILLIPWYKGKAESI